MARKKKSSSDENFSYSKNESFENLEAVQKMALDKRGKDDEPNPDITLFLKAEELKGKLCGLYNDKEKSSQNINVMGSVVIDGKELSLNVGSNPDTNKNTKNIDDED